MAIDIAKICLQGLEIARKTLDDLGEQGREEEYKPGEPLTKGDLAVSKVLRRFFSESGIPVIIYDEEDKGKPFFTCSNPKYGIYIDPVDGTFNYQRGGVLPSTTVISVFNYSENLKFEDAIFGAIMDLKTKDLWYAKKRGGCCFNEKRVITSGKKDLGKDTFLMIDQGPCPSIREIEKFSEIYNSSWPHNVSSAGFHLAGVSSGHFDAFIGPLQKAHELGAGNLLVKEAGGVVIDFNGRPIDEEDFDFNKTYPIIAAATPKLAERLRRLIDN